VPFQWSRPLSPAAQASSGAMLTTARSVPISGVDICCQVVPSKWPISLMPLPPTTQMSFGLLAETLL
jgi:hypothetical protein